MSKKNLFIVIALIAMVTMLVSCHWAEKEIEQSLFQDYSDYSILVKNDSTTNERLVTLLNHPKYALNNASKYFKLTELEQDIIVSHMFPISAKLPKYAEGWVVNLVDDAVAIAEVSYKARNKLAYAVNFALILLLAYFK